MNDIKYKLIDTVTNNVIKTVILNMQQAAILNYAYALNGVTKKYVK